MQVSPESIEFLHHTDTCTVSNAIEKLNVRMRDEGYVQRGAHCIFPQLPPVADYAVTARMRAAAPPISDCCYPQCPDWWKFVSSIRGPKIIAIEDVVPAHGTGALFGETYAGISRAFGCVAYLTHGAVRHLPQLEALRFQCFAREAIVSHSYSYAHIIEFGEPVVIGGLKIWSGDLLHGDCNSMADRLQAAVNQTRAREAELFRLCELPDFSVAKLEDVFTKEGHEI